jgi:hypothetical protein
MMAAGGLWGCDGFQPSIYRVAVDRLTAEAIPTTCYRSGQAPTFIADKSTNIVDQQQWVFWEGIDDTAYLETGTINYAMGQAQRVTIAGDAIQGTKTDGKYTFASERTQTDSTTEIYTTSASYTIDKLGDTVEGSLALHSHCTGSDCAGIPSCDASLKFVGRKIDADPLSIYSAEPGT